MCDPITATIAMAAGTAISAGGSLYKGFRGSKAAKLQAEIARGNIDILHKQADVQRGEAELATKRGTFLEAKQRGAAEATLGQQAAYFGAVGFDPGVGSPLLLAGATAAQAETDAGLIRSQAALDRASALARVAQTQAQASGQATAAYQAEERATDEMMAGIFGAASSILGGVGRIWGPAPGTGARLWGGSEAP
jgi:membrane protein involved in colicin uptake